jgi:hypothetical protein
MPFVFYNGSQCRFCRLHLYDSQEIYKHMEQRHYHCHLCRRDNPEKHDYFNQYEQLEEHFRSKHHPCPFERCREAKFVVFANESELKRHVAQEHGDELNMNKHERRAAMTVETGFMSVPRVCPCTRAHMHVYLRSPAVVLRMYLRPWCLRWWHAALFPPLAHTPKSMCCQGLSYTITAQYPAFTLHSSVLSMSVQNRQNVSPLDCWMLCRDTKQAPLGPVRAPQCTSRLRALPPSLGEVELARWT